MAEYINREEAIQRIRKAASIVGFENPSVAIDCVISVIERVPAADVVDVVRCKDCKHIIKNIHGVAMRWCRVWDRANGMGDDGYCNYGERKEGAE